MRNQTYAYKLVQKIFAQVVILNFILLTQHFAGAGYEIYVTLV
jgi:hypothetical protein